MITSKRIDEELRSIDGLDWITALRVHSFRTLLEDLGTLAKNRVRVRGSSEAFYVMTQPTALQTRALNLLGVPHAS